MPVQLNKRSQKYFIVAIIITVALITTALFEFLYLRNNVKSEATEYLENNSSLRVELLERWLQRRIQNGNSILKNKLILDEIENALKNKTNNELNENIQSWMRDIISEYDYNSILLLDKNLRETGLSAGIVENRPYIHKDLYNHILSEGKVFLVDLHSSAIADEVHLELLVPLRETITKKPFALLVLNANAANTVYRFLNWTGKEKSGEVLIVKQDGDSVEFMSGLKKIKDNISFHKISIDEKEVIAVKAVQGLTGMLEGIDYKGEEVLAYVISIKGSEWKLITKIDTSEVYDEVNKDGIFLLFIIILTAGGLFTVVIAIRKNSDKIRLSDELIREKEKSELLEHVDHLIMNANDIIMTIAEDGSILNVNRKGLKKYGFSREEITKLNVRDIRQAEALGVLEKQLYEIKAGNGLVFETIHKSKEGKEFPVEVSSRYIKLAEKGYFEAIIREITERKSWEKKLIGANRLYSVLSQVNQTIVRSKDKDKLFKALCDVITNFGKYKLAWIGKIEGEQIIPVAASGAAIQFIDTLKVSITEDEYSNDPTGRAVKEGRCIIINKLETDELKPWNDGNIRYKFKSVVAAPLKAFGNTLNTLTICSGEDEIFNDDDMELIEEIAMDISFAIERLEMDERERILEEQQRETLRQYKTLVDNLPGAVYRCKNDKNWTMEYLSPGFEHLFGYRIDEILFNNKLSFDDLIVEEDKQRVYDVIQSSINEKLPFALTYKIRRKDNTIIYIGERGAGVYDNAGKLLALEGVLNDVTIQMTAIEELKISREKYRRLAEKSHDLIFVLNTKSKFIEMSYTSEEMLGYAPFEMIGKSIFEFALPEDIEMGKDLLNRIVTNNEELFNYESKIVAKNGNIINLKTNALVIRNEQGKVSGIMGASKNITQEVLATKKLRESELRFRKLAENAKDIVFRYSINPPSIEYVSPSVTDITGYTPDEFYKNYMLGKKIIYPADLIGLTKSASSSKEKDEPCVTRLIRKDGAIVWLELQFYSEFGDDGEFVALEGIARDVTERVKANTELKNAKEKAEQANRLKSNFLSNMSHELRTPMVGIMGYSELLKETCEKEEQKEMAEHLLKSSKRLNETLNSILDLSKIEAQAVDFVLKKIDANKIIRECIKTYEIVATNKKLDLNFITNKVELPVICDEILLFSVIDNLISNAIKFTSKGHIKVRSRSEDSRAIIDVEDTGVGISKDNLDLIFEPFRQVSEGYSREFEGTGLGLTITKNYVNLMDGELKVYSELNKGSIFTISLKAADEKQEKRIKEKSERSVNLSEKEKIRILNVEDDDISASVLDLMLSGDFEITRTVTGEEAIELAEKNSYSMILMDISLKGEMDGLQATKKIREMENCKNIPVIAVTALAMSGDREKFLGEGCSDYISKPYSKNELLKVMERALKSIQ